VPNVSLLQQLVEIVGREHVLTDPDVVRPHARDWTGRWSADPLAVVRPGSTDEVAAVVAACAAAGTPVVTQGGNTGLVGGSVPVAPQSVIVSTRRLTEHGQVDAARRQVVVGAGLTIADLHALAAQHQLTYGVDLASRDSATVGGTVATNAGGVRVVRFGDTRAQVRGVEAVFADGSVMNHTDALGKDSAGFDISRLLVGSEGTLALITSVQLQLQDALPRDRVTSLVGVPTLSDAVATVAGAGERSDLLAAEYMDTTGMELVCDVAHLPHPLQDRWPYYVLIETVGEPRLPDAADAAVDRRLWVYRERQPEAAATLGVVHAVDVALPLEQLDAVVDQLPRLVHPHRVFTFGHLAEGNLHVQVVGPPAHDDTLERTVLAVVADHGGSISSEHGVGRTKPAYLPLCRDAAELAAMRTVKDALDPRGLLNPGVLFPPRESAR
jgi:FAD/FMN-containing dehydrogenase